MLPAKPQDSRSIEYSDRMYKAKAVVGGRVVTSQKALTLFNCTIRSGDQIILEGNNQKQATFLAKTLSALSASKIHSLHLMMSSITLDEHLDVFEKRIAHTIDFSFSGAQAKRLYSLVKQGLVKIGSIHTYNELYSRYFTDRRPNVALVAAEYADNEGNLFTGANSEETQLICEATRFSKGIVIAQVKEVVENVSRVDIPASQVDFIIPTGEATSIKPLFTRDPAKITNQHILMAMMTIKGIYAEYQVKSLNHGIGYATAAIELVLPNYIKKLAMENKICTHWLLNPHPTLIPFIEAGYVKSIHSFGSEPGMGEYIKAYKDIFFTSQDGVLKSNRPICQMAGHYAIDCFVGATLQIDRFGNSSTAIKGRIAGFGGAPNLGANPLGRRHCSPAWQKAGLESYSTENQQIARGRKIVVQITPTFGGNPQCPVFVNELDAVEMHREGIFDSPPVMIYSEDITHIVTERGIAYLGRCHTSAEKEAAIRSIAGNTPVGQGANRSETNKLRTAKIVAFPEDLGINPKEATRDLLAAKDFAELQQLSGNLYTLPEYFR